MKQPRHDALSFLVDILPSSIHLIKHFLPTQSGIMEKCTHVIAETSTAVSSYMVCLVVVEF